MYKTISISGNPLLVSTVLVCCVFGHLSFGWFWAVFIIDELCGFAHENRMNKAKFNPTNDR